jgi:hypothetical protein
MMQPKPLRTQGCKAGQNRVAGQVPMNATFHEGIGESLNAFEMYVFFGADISLKDTVGRSPVSKDRKVRKSKCWRSRKSCLAPCLGRKEAACQTKLHGTMSLYRSPAWTGLSIL